MREFLQRADVRVVLLVIGFLGLTYLSFEFLPSKGIVLIPIKHEGWLETITVLFSVVVAFIGVDYQIKHSKRISDEDKRKQVLPRLDVKLTNTNYEEIGPVDYYMYTEIKKNHLRCVTDSSEILLFLEEKRNLNLTEVDLSSKKNAIMFEFKNIGLGSAYNVMAWLCRFDESNQYNLKFDYADNDKPEWLFFSLDSLFLSNNQEWIKTDVHSIFFNYDYGRDFTLKIQFSDIYTNVYTQEVKFVSFSFDRYYIKAIGNPVLVTS